MHKFKYKNVSLCHLGLLLHPLPSSSSLQPATRANNPNGNAYNNKNFFCALIQEEVVTVELVDATDPGEHNGDTVSDPETGLASRTVLLDESTSQANVSIRR